MGLDMILYIAYPRKQLLGSTEKGVVFHGVRVTIITNLRQRAGVIGGKRYPPILVTLEICRFRMMGSMKLTAFQL